MGDRVNTYLETGDAPFSYLQDSLERKLDKSDLTDAERLKTSQNLRIARALHQLDYVEVRGDIEQMLVGNVDIGKRTLDGMGVFFLAQVEKALVNEPILNKVDAWFGKNKPELTEEIIANDEEIRQSGMEGKIQDKLEQALATYHKFMFRGAQVGSKLQVPFISENDLPNDRRKYIREQMFPLRLNKVVTDMAGIIDMFGYGVLSLDNPTTQSLINEYGENLYKYAFFETVETEYQDDLDTWTPSKYYLLAKEAFGAEKFGKLQARIFELKVVLNERKNFGDHKDGNEDEELPERAKARPEEFRMLFAAARIAKEIYISQRDDRPINTELLSEEYERVIADYDSGLEDLNELKIKSVLGNDVYKAFRLGSIPYLSNSSNLLMGVSQTVDSA